ncbi:uncharacterized protein LOC108682805 [Hyalella azteca]|uniref:Uncharacterized protein LOC108682805 n=1 Tax=Hyalella azteca TaxID=294128 RepID=A0A8B7PMW1_HYAAZ|nr:uncharacterized protein LOC108682805 [Hyalella azteca]
MIFQRLLHFILIILIILILPLRSCLGQAPATHIVTETGQCVTIAPKLALLKSCDSSDPSQKIYRVAVNATHIVMLNEQRSKALCYARGSRKVMALKIKNYCMHPSDDILRCEPRRRNFECHIQEINAQGGYFYFNFGKGKRDYMAWGRNGKLQKARDRFCKTNESNKRRKIRHLHSKSRSGSERSRELLPRSFERSQSASYESGARSFEDYASVEGKNSNYINSLEKHETGERFLSGEHNFLRDRASSERQRGHVRRRGSRKCRRKKDKFMRFMYKT